MMQGLNDQHEAELDRLREVIDQETDKRLVVEKEVQTLKSTLEAVQAQFSQVQYWFPLLLCLSQST